MKFKNLKKIILIFFLVFSFCFEVTADSGWDTDYGGGYDYGGSYDFGGYDYDYGHDYNYHFDTGNRNYNLHSSSSDDDDFPSFLYIIVLVLIIVSFCQDVTPAKKAKPKKRNFMDISEKELQKYLPDCNLEDLKNMAVNKFIDIQEAWSTFDYETLRKLCTDELYNTYSTQLNVLKIKEQQNIMDDYKPLDIKLLNVKCENNLVTLIFYLDISFFDYVINNNNKVVRGTNLYKLNNQYYLHFVRSQKGTDNLTNCPNCKAPIADVTSQTCPYCGSVIVKDANDFVLSKKMKAGVF